MSEVKRFIGQAPSHSSLQTGFLWVIQKRFHLARSRTGFIIAALAVVSGNFSLLYTLALMAGGGLIFIPASIITIIALVAILLYPTLHSDYDIGILKAFGAKRSTIATLYFVELLFTGVTGALMGIAAGSGLIILASLLKLYTFPIPNSIAAYGLLILPCALGVIAGSLVGVCKIWKKVSHTTAEILTNAK